MKQKGKKCRVNETLWNVYEGLSYPGYWISSSESKTAGVCSLKDALWIHKWFFSLSLWGRDKTSSRLNTHKSSGPWLTTRLRLMLQKHLTCNNPIFTNSNEVCLLQFTTNTSSFVFCIFCPFGNLYTKAITDMAGLPGLPKLSVDHVRPTQHKKWYKRWYNSGSAKSL